MEKIKITLEFDKTFYESKNGFCHTVCKMLANNDSIMIGSIGCECCDYNIITNKKENYVVCKMKNKRICKKYKFLSLE